MCVCVDVFTQPVPGARDRRTDAARAQQRARARAARHTGDPSHVIQSVSVYDCPTLVILLYSRLLLLHLVFQLDKQTDFIFCVTI